MWSPFERMCPQETDLWTIFKESFGLIDILFVALGLGTAFKMLAPAG